MITIDDVKFIIEEVFADFYESALGKNSSGEYDEDVKKLDIRFFLLSIIFFLLSFSIVLSL